MAELKLVYCEDPSGDHSPVSGVSVQFALDGASMRADYEVRTTATHVNPMLASDSAQWGLWDWDVVELFVSANAASTYYEFQVSPLAQYFELEIFEPRKRVNREFKSGFGRLARLTDELWRTEMRIPLEKIGWDGSPASIRGNAFAVLGRPGARSFWSLYLEPQQTPDFHLPQYFRPLLTAD